MKSKLLLAAVLCLAVVSCDLFESQKFGDIIMVDGPRYEDGDTTFSFVGTVRNVGNGKALFVRVIMHLRNPDDISLAQASKLVDKTDLEPGESSAWRVTFDDETRDLRDLMDESKTEYDITWSEED